MADEKINRKRNKQIKVWLSEEELLLFQSQYEKSEAKNRADFILRLLDEKPITVNYELIAVLAELKKQGTNLNQIAKQLNQGFPYEESSKKIIEECWTTYRKLLDMNLR